MSRKHRIIRAAVVLVIFASLVAGIAGSSVFQDLAAGRTSPGELVTQVSSDIESAVGSIRPIGAPVEYTIITDQSTGAGVSGPKGVGNVLGDKLSGAGGAIGR